MLASRCARYISTNHVLWQSNTKKSLLAELRKKTGYPFINCKKALELHDNDLAKAESWLKEQAQALGWSKAEKLQGRSTSQGLVGVIFNQFHGALVEINCETDFVARNKEFHQLTDTVASAVLKHTIATDSNGMYNRTVLDADALKALQALDGKSVADHSALAIGTLGENILVRRALCMYVPQDTVLFGYSHPTPTESGSTSFGRYGALVAFKTTDDKETIGKQLCQHIIGMNPTKIGDPEIDVEKSEDSDNEKILIHQDFLFDSTITVQELLEETNTQILDFARFEMGEVVEGQQSLDAVETGG
ncbi:elongation factor Ts, mitochondrial [Copidosoma floridanum]|uniref:elongation factor Ts, mitochondrial n=1 Tax=Copidosoma floridanum TaxID=29053 RepID=UPI0006C9477A|nr:elongation factor Ts, mitochondrial [Copidosoma floridanum]